MPQMREPRNRRSGRGAGPGGCKRVAHAAHRPDRATGANPSSRSRGSAWGVIMHMQERAIYAILLTAEFAIGAAHALSTAAQACR